MLLSKIKGNFRFCLAALVVAGLMGCKSSNVEMKLSVAGADAVGADATDTTTTVGGNFFTNGFPTNLRLRDDGTIDISDFPRRFHLLTSEYVTAIDTYINIGGFHPISPIYLPFTGAMDIDALSTWDLDFAQESSPIQVVDVDPSSPEYGRRFPLEISMTKAMDSYRPRNLLQLIPTFGVNLRPNTTYAAFVTDQVPLPEDNTLEQNEQLATVLNPDLALVPVTERALAVYKPLRDYLEQQQIESASIMGATVWTTGDPTTKMIAGAEYVAGLPTPGPTKMKQIEDYPDYCVVEGYVEVPGYQNGTAPYVIFGGDIQWDDEGKPIQVYTRDARFVVTVPKNVTMPEQGYPNLFFHHGAGGNAIQVYTRGKYLRTEYDIIVPYSVVDVGNGPAQIAAERGWASSGFGGHMGLDHLGVERGGFGGFGYNMFNPVSLFNNYYQMVWERIYFRRFLKTLEVSPELCADADTGGADKFKFDPDMQVIMGQSLGNWTGSLQLAVDPEPFQGVVFTGMAGVWSKLFSNNSLMRSAVSAGVVNLLPGQRLDNAHPFLMLMEWLLGSADPVPYMDSVLRAPTKEAPHILAISGLDDQGSGEYVQRTLMMSVGLDLAGPDLGDTYDTTLFPHLEISGQQQLPYPVVNNIEVPGQGQRTAVVVRYENTWRPDHNGHHVTFDLDPPKHQYGCFMEQLAQGIAPVIHEGFLQGDPCP